MYTIYYIKSFNCAIYLAGLFLMAEVLQEKFSPLN